MSDDNTRAITRVESHTVQAAQAAVAHDHEPPRQPSSDGRAATPQPPARPVLPELRETDLAYAPDPASEHILVQIVDRDTGSVMRSFPLDLPGDRETSDQEPARGALVDAKA